MHGLITKNDDLVRENTNKFPSVKEKDMINKAEVLLNFEKDNKVT